MHKELPITISLPAGFLNAEVRCGEFIDERKKRVFAVQLDLLKKLLDVCRMNDIKVVVFAGTLLGAVRHKGFIPWDDDVDVCMDRSNFEKLRNLPGDTFAHPYFLQTAFSDRKFFCPYARLRNCLTTGAIVGEDFPEYNNGIYVDIFVLDGYSSYSWFVLLQRKLKSFCIEGITALTGKMSSAHGLIVSMIHVLMPLWRFIGYGRMVWFYERVIAAATRTAHRISLVTHDVFFIERYWLWKNELEDILMLPFENILVPAPKAYDSVLKRIYGKYMEYPPLGERGKWHDNQVLMDPDMPYLEYLSRNTSMRRAWFVSFADSRMKQPLKRIRKQALTMGFAEDRILTMTECDLDPAFMEKMKEHLVKGSRGYGYWCWRPQVVLQALRRMADNEILLYADAGCHLNPKGLHRLREYLEMTNESGMLAFQGRSLLGTEEYDPLHHFNAIAQWTKGDVLEYFGVRNNDRVLLSGQYSGGVFLVKKTASSIAFYEQYLEIAEQHFNFFDDSPSTVPNHPTFREPRHDQSVFTLLCMQHGVRTLSTCEYGVYSSLAPEKFWNNPAWSCRSFDEMDRFPVHAKRDTAWGLRAFIPRSIRLFLLRGAVRFSRRRHA